MIRLRLGLDFVFKVKFSVLKRRDMDLAEARPLLAGKRFSSILHVCLVKGERDESI